MTWKYYEPGKNRLTPLRKAILELGLTQRELAQRAGIHETQISMMANGRYIPEREQASRIARVLGMPEIELFPYLTSQRNQNES